MIWFILLLGILALAFSSHLFPWDFLAERFAALGLDWISQIFDRRRYETAIVVILAIGMICAFYYNDTFMYARGECRAYFQADALVLRLDANGDGMYLPAGSDEDFFVKRMSYVYYDGYVAKDNVTGKKYETYCTADSVGIWIPSGYNGAIAVRYQGKWY